MYELEHEQTLNLMYVYAMPFIYSTIFTQQRADWCRFSFFVFIINNLGSNQKIKVLKLIYV